MDTKTTILFVIFVIGRIIFGLYFIRSAYHHFTRVSGMAGYAGARGVPSPKLMVVITGILLFLGGLSMLLGIKPFIGGILLILFLVPVTFSMHNYWKDQDPGMKMGNNVNFYKNLALLGAVLMIMALPWPKQIRLW
jgi:putative oxidoreductase